MRRPAGAGEDPPHRLFPLQVEVERHGTQRRIEKGAFVGIVIANNRLLTRHRHLMLMEGAEHPQRHLIITHQHSAEIRRFAQHLQRAGVAALRIPVAVQDGHRLQTVTIRGLQPAF